MSGTKSFISTDFLIEALSFDDVLIEPRFSMIDSRKNVSTKTKLNASSQHLSLDIPIISANMDTVTESNMANAMADAGGVGCLHRFMDVDKNINEYKKSPKQTLVSIGVGEKEYERALSLYENGAYNFVIDVAHGAAINVVKQYDALRSALNKNAFIMVGNFATAKSIEEFCERSRSRIKPDAFKIGIGGGSLCTTRVVTGCGLPTLSSVLDCRSTRRTLVADGGIRNSGDIVKALAAGASAVMLGSLLSGTEQTPGEIVAFEKNADTITHYHKYKEAPELLWHKKYRGSASKDSYISQNKIASHRAPEGEVTLVKYKGDVKNILNELVAGLKSGMSYVNATTLDELQENTRFYKVTKSGSRESQPHGKI